MYISLTNLILLQSTWLVCIDALTYRSCGSALYPRALAVPSNAIILHIVKRESPLPSRRVAESIGRRDDAESKRREEQQVHSASGAGDHQFWGCSLTCSCSTSSGWGGHTHEHDRSNAAVFLSLHCATLHSRFEYPEISYISDIFLFKFSGICFELLRETNQIIAQIKPDCNKGILG